MMVQLLKLYLELDHLSNWCINNEYTPKYGDFFEKNDESIL